MVAFSTSNLNSKVVEKLIFLAFGNILVFVVAFSNSKKLIKNLLPEHSAVFWFCWLLFASKILMKE